MTDEAAFLAAIRAAPDDDTPRLVYADWLDERGQPGRAEFIRLGCEIERRWGESLITSYRDDPACRRAYKRYWKLREKGFAGVPGWLLAMPESNHPADFGNPYPYSTHRGFVSKVRVPWPLWLQHGDALLARHPVRRVALSDWPETDPGTRNMVGGQVVPWKVIWADRDTRADAVVQGDRSGQFVYLAPRIGPMTLAHRWPGVAFELPPAEPALSPAAAMRAAGDYARGVEAALANRLARVLNGDPAVGTPAGVIDASDSEG